MPFLEFLIRAVQEYRKINVVLLSKTQQEYNLEFQIFIII